MRHWEFFLPRKFLMTNAMLKALRAAGHYEGARGSRPKSRAYDEFAAEVRSIRSDVAMFCRRWVRPIGEPLKRLGFEFIFIGHEDCDPDAGLLPAKYLVDGICSALGLTSDRRIPSGMWTRNHTAKGGSLKAFQDLLSYSSTFAEPYKFEPGVIVYLMEASS